MKKLILVLLLVLSFLAGMVVAYANPSWLGTQEIYNRVFNYNDKMTNCGSCFAGKLNKLKSLFDKYE